MVLSAVGSREQGMWNGRAQISGLIIIITISLSSGSQHYSQYYSLLRTVIIGSVGGLNECSVLHRFITNRFFVSLK